MASAASTGGTDIFGPSERKKSERRRRLLIDPEYQFRDVNRIIGAFLLFLLIQALLFSGIAVLLQRDVISSVSATVALTVAAFFTPVGLCVYYAWLSVHGAHHVAGAAYRISQDLPNALRNPSFRFHLRDNDYLWEVVVELNRVMCVLEARQIGIDELDARIQEFSENLPPLLDQLPPEMARPLELRLEQIETALARARTLEPPEPCDNDDQAFATLVGSNE